MLGKVAGPAVDAALLSARVSAARVLQHVQTQTHVCTRARAGTHPTDVRMTTRFSENDLVDALLAAIHETGAGPRI